MQTKKCSGCGEVKAKTEFYKNTTRKDGLRGRCKLCADMATRKWEKENRTRYNETQKLCARKNRQLKREQFSAHRAKNRKKYPEKAKAQSIITCLIQKGEITKLPCAVCGKTKVEAHHPDYSKPYDVIWLCRYDHLQKHKSEIGG